MSAPTEGVLATPTPCHECGGVPSERRCWWCHGTGKEFSWDPIPSVPAISVAECERLVAEARAEERAAERERCAAIVARKRRNPKSWNLALDHYRWQLNRGWREACDAITDAIEADR